ncbi:TWiK family of potassium channels protein 18-like [Glandiceps talaboti]
MDEENNRRCRCRFGLKCKFLILTILVVAYVVGGAWLFATLENPNQKQTENDINMLRERIIGNLTNVLDIDPRENVTLERVRILLNDYQTMLYATFKSGGSPAGTGIEWDWTTGCFFCITVLTTIGYGSLVPVTMHGKIVTIVYAVIGIPLFLIFLAKLGDILVNVIRNCCLKCCAKKRKRGSNIGMRKTSSKYKKDGKGPVNDDDDDDGAGFEDTDIPISPFIVVYLLYIGAGSGIFYYLQKDWDFVDALYFTVITFTTIGFGDLVPAYTSSGGLSKFTELTQDLAGDKLNFNFNISAEEKAYIRHADFALLIWYIIIGMVIMSCIFNLLLVRLRHLSHILSTKRRRDKFALNQNTFDGPREGQIRKVPPKNFY